MKIINKATTRLVITVNGIIEIGLITPKTGKIKFVKNPINIITIMLKPTTNNMVSRFSSPWSLKIFINNKPGTRNK
jgi:hypothetical protein